MQRTRLLESDAYFSDFSFDGMCVSIEQYVDLPAKQLMKPIGTSDDDFLDIVRVAKNYGSNGATLCRQMV